ncbi:probable E3 ubiquitin ligase SUD1 isoform X1 [Aegilops tauschii subsp. strangulata]|uniref:RING-CH-type domain-containing protein n=5 Tax=Aegilops tauschii subsp. strangulata TaxID=200361 RepID=A0A453A308_AEGTS|nr:probable E3 ubiquitin ligase SUD1 [Aegilops tauschii subsp. strangulata]
MGAAVAVLRRTAAGEEAAEEEEQCRICRDPADADRPLRRPCGCKGSMRFVHDHCQIRWLKSRRQSLCEVCRRQIFTRPIYAAGTPAPAPAPARPVCLLLALLYLILTALVAWALAGLCTWRLALARSRDEALRLLSIRLYGPAALAHLALKAEHTFRANYGARLRRCQFATLRLLRFSLSVVMGDMALACILAFLPFTLGRIALLCRAEVDSYASTPSTLLFGYGFIFSLGATFAGLHTFHQYLRSEDIFFESLFDIFFSGIIKFIIVVNISLNLINTAIIWPLLFAWSLDICTSKMFDATIFERFKPLFASIYVSTALQWLIGCALLDLVSIFSGLHSMILRPGVTSPFVDHNVNIRDPFYKFYFKKLPGLFIGIILIAMVIVVPIQIAGRLSTGKFLVDIIYFNIPTKGTSFWSAPQNYTDSLCGVLLVRFLIGHTHALIGFEWIVKKVMHYTFPTGQTLGLSVSVTVWPNGAFDHDGGSSVAPKDKYGSTNEAKDKRRRGVLNTYPCTRRLVSLRIILHVMLGCLTVMICNSAVLILTISVGRALLFTIPQLPLTGGFKSNNDLLALVVGFGIISTIIATSRDLFAYMSSGRKHLVALNRCLIVFLWFAIIPFLIGLLVDLSLISPFTGPDDGVPVLDLFYTWFLGWLLLKIWVKWVHWPLSPFLAYLTDESRVPRLTRAKLDWPRGAMMPLPCFFRDIFVPVATKLLAALGVPYVLAGSVFPSLGCSAAVNSTVRRSAWLGCIGLCALCHLAKLFWVLKPLDCRAKLFWFFSALCSRAKLFWIFCFEELHDSVRDERVVIGQRLEDFPDDG